MHSHPVSIRACNLTHIRRFLVIASLLCCEFLLPVSVYASVTASVDRNTINEGDTFILDLKVSNSDQPDLSPLHKDFDVLGTAQRSEIQIISGSINSQHTWSITLSPHHTGKLTIPPITVGNSQSTAIAVTVLPAGTAINNGPDKGDVFLEVNVTPEHSYVQQQLIYTVRLYYDAPLKQGTLSDPAPNNAIVQKLGKDSNFETQRGGRHYEVIERRYAIFPQRSGTLDIPAVVFNGAVSDPSAGTGDPFFDSFNPMTRNVRLRSNKFTLNVTSQPASYTGTYWLPARDIELEQKWSPKQPQFKVGEPVTRTLIVHAKGLSASQLPDLLLPNVNGLKLYPDQPQTHNTASGDNLEAEREIKIAMIPTQAGDMTLPAIHLDWWDTQANRQRTATLPAQTIDVLPGDNNVTGTTPMQSQTNTAVTPSQPATTTNAPALTPNPTIPTQSQTGVMHMLWIIVAGVFALAWLITMLLWWRQRRTPTPAAVITNTTNELSEQAALKTVRQACAQQDPQTIKRTLLYWARQRWPENPPLSLGALATRVNNEVFATALSTLDKTLYETGTADWRAESMQQALELYLKQTRQAKHAQDESVLAPLHPKQSRTAGR